ncbi:MAG: hypothetical protein HYX65_02170 [Gemmatimonadetes bacterium]|nr:hypothetical protein [Gemmatimonadota bacterium]
MRDRLRNTSPEERRAAAERIRDRREGMTPEQRDAARIGARERPRGTPTQAQRDLAQALRDKRRRLREDVKAGKTDRHTAAEELRAWMRDHRPGSGGGEG